MRPEKKRNLGDKAQLLVGLRHHSKFKRKSKGGVSQVKHTLATGGKVTLEQNTTLHGIIITKKKGGRKEDTDHWCIPLLNRDKVCCIMQHNRQKLNLDLMVRIKQQNERGEKKGRGFYVCHVVSPKQGRGVGISSRTRRRGNDLHQSEHDVWRILEGRMAVETEGEKQCTEHKSFLCPKGTIVLKNGPQRKQEEKRSAVPHLCLAAKGRERGGRQEKTEGGGD